MTPQLRQLLAGQWGVATYRQIRAVIGRRVMERLVRDGHLVKVWPGIYSGAKPSVLTRLRGLDLRCGEPVAVCLHTAAAVHGFDTEQPSRLHVLNPQGYQLRDDDALAVHRREGVPLTTVRGRLVTPPAWTAVEVARGVDRPRALATLDAALRSQTCDVPGLWRAAEAQAARRGIVKVRELIGVGASAGRISDGERGAVDDARRGTARAGAAAADHRSRRRGLAGGFRLA